MKIYKDKNVLVVELDNQVVIGNSTIFKEEVRKNISNIYNNVVLDFSDVKFIDSSGIGAIISILKSTTEKNGKVRICNPKEDVKRILNMVKLDQLIEIYNNKDEALKNLQ